MEAIIINSKLLVSRNALREAKREHLKLTKIVIAAELLMTELIFESDLKYEDAYNKVLLNWNYNIEFVDKILKPKYCSINQYYFHLAYRPIEKCFKSNLLVFSKLN